MNNEEKETMKIMLRQIDYTGRYSIYLEELYTRTFDFHEKKEIKGILDLLKEILEESTEAMRQYSKFITFQASIESRMPKDTDDGPIWDIEDITDSTGIPRKEVMQIIVDLELGNPNDILSWSTKKTLLSFDQVVLLYNYYYKVDKISQK